MKGSKTMMKDRITLSVTTNMDGSDKQPLFQKIIHIAYIHTQKTFKDECVKFNDRIKKQNRKVLLLVYNAPVHNLEEHVFKVGTATAKINMSIAEVMVFPAHCTSIL